MTTFYFNCTDPIIGINCSHIVKICSVKNFIRIAKLISRRKYMDILTFNFFSIMIYGVLFLNKYTKDKWKNIFLILTTIQLIVLNGFRDLSIGVDTYRYARHFYRIR